MNKTPVELGPVQETLLIPLYGRAELLRDAKAVSIVESLDYDFTKWKGARSLVGVAIRTRMFDEEVRSFLTEHPDGTVVEIGAGLNTRYERLDNGRARWLELDLPDSMALRRRFFEETERRVMVAASVLDAGWHERVCGLPGPYCFVSEAAIIYLAEPEVERVLRALAARFAGAVLVTDTTSAGIVAGQERHDVMKAMPRASRFRWGCDDPKALARWGLALERSRTFLDAPTDARVVMPWPHRLLFSLAPWLVRRRWSGYRINRFRLGGAPP